jgi:signal transduction histidine kinase
VVTLDASPVFGQLKPGELNALRSVAREKSFPAGAEIFKEGDAGDGIYLVKEGLVELLGVLDDKAAHVFSRVEAGDMFGEMAVIEDKPRSATAIAREWTTVYFFGRAQMLKLVEDIPPLAFVFLREISSRLREFNRHYLEQTLQTERLAVVGRFARSIVHDLKNPLNIIGLTAELAGSEKASLETRRQSQGRIRTQVDRISDMISEILEFTQGSQSAVILSPSDYGIFATHVLDEMRPEIALKSASFEVAEQPPSVRVHLDPKRLRRVFTNLVHNATDAMPSGGKILVRFLPSEKEIVTEIEDTGPGIAPEIAGKLFEAFATHGKAHGTGLGLSICKRIIQDHRGWIGARTEPGRGAIFSFGLPVAARR